jgi:photosystem II stability/assembly factor-like uncharacterized protein
MRSACSIWRTTGTSLLILFGSCASGAPEPLALAVADPDLLQWRPLPSPCAASLRGLAAVDGGTAYVGGANGNLWRTDDGGRTWTSVAPPDSALCDFRDLEVTANDTVLAMVAGQPARVYRSADRGLSWQIVLADLRPAAFFDAMAFVGDFGVLFGDPIDGLAQVFVTEDGGRLWRPLPSSQLPAPLSGEAAFAASGSCVQVDGEAGDERIAIVTGGAERARLWLGGRRQPFVATDLPLQSGSASKGAFGLMLLEGEVIAVGGDYEQPKATAGTVAVSVDGGSSFATAEAGGFRSAVLALRDGTWLAVGSDGASRSLDGGQSWQLLPTVGWHSLAAGADGTIWCCGEGGRVAKVDLLSPP